MQISVEVVLGRGEDATELKDLASGLQAYVAVRVSIVMCQQGNNMTHCQQGNTMAHYPMPSPHPCHELSSRHHACCCTCCMCCLQPEAMTGPNQYKIEPGNRYVDAYKQMTLDQPPDELVIQLKRVDFDFIAGRRLVCYARTQQPTHCAGLLNESHGALRSMLSVQCMGILYASAQYELCLCQPSPCMCQLSSAYVWFTGTSSTTSTRSHSYWTFDCT